MVELSQWSIAKRISFIAAVLSAGLVVSGAQGLFASWRIGAIFETYRYDTVESAQIDELRAEVLNAKKYEMQFRRVASEELVELTRTSLSDAMRKSNAAQDTYARKPGVFDALVAVENSLGNFRSAFEKAIGHERELAVRSDEFKARGTEALKQINALTTTLMFDNNQRAIVGLGESKQSFLLARIFVESFLFKNDPEYLQTAIDHMNAARTRLADVAGNLTNESRREQAQKIIDEAEAFWTTAEAAMAAIKLRNTVRDQLDQTSDDLTARLDSITEELDKGLASHAAKGEQTLISTVTLQAFLVIASIVLCVVLARKVQRGISDAMAGSVAAMRRLAEGDLETKIEGHQRDDELGAIAKALISFRENGLERRRLEAEQKRQADAKEEEKAERARKDAEAEAARQRQVEEARQAMLTRLRDAVGDVVDAGARGHFSVRIDAAFEEPELTQLARSINQLVDNVDRGLTEAARIMAEMAEGNLADSMHGAFDGKFAELKISVNQTVESLGDLLDQIRGQCEGVGESAARMTEQSGELARRAEQQAASLEETSAAMEEISASARSSADGASNAAEFAQSASQQVNEAEGVVASAVGAMSDIQDASDRIGEIVSVIDGIAFQTNLLALNASVEAARAGTAGKGFAVVATEVRALAQRSGEASKDIKELIEESATQVRRGVELVEQTGATLGKIMTGVSQMASTMQELTATAREQATGVGEVTSAISQLDVITQKNAALSDETREAAYSMAGQAQAMQALVGRFRTRSGGTAMGSPAPDTIAAE
ncbi:methyl-accepting chemotaxis protein [Ovoidimarina sediminis]|uniref:methyl-accepting chemotaxis protein n=1 Tax=Ovoidimarina sediminis TaxID=3079856 RepID=UPI00290DC9F3|nr:methyl-accepting chemotaxis protein [Rhodophyticola sp. MJ-SS7]MDU8944902.1 methyl-accepting chemotaxis protein [Rhodophyticola sp. MJ-SS7]